MRTHNVCSFHTQRLLLGPLLPFLFVFQIVRAFPFNLLAPHDFTAVERVTSSVSGASPTAFVPLSQKIRDELLLRNKVILDASFQLISSSPPIMLEAATDDSINSVLWNNKRDFSSDRVVRVLEDDVVIKLEKNGLVSLAGLQFSKGIHNSDCISSSHTTPTTKLKQLLPPKTAVRVHLADSGAREDRRPRKAIVLVHNTPWQQHQQTDTIVATSIQEELLRRGYAKVRSTSLADDDSSFPSRSLLDHWTAVQEQAQLNKIGPLYQESCPRGASLDDIAVDTQFEPIPLTTRTDWGDSTATTTKPKNPGDSVGCSDFETYEDALRWYERYLPWYGDVAKLDRDGDGIPCPGLAHTKDHERYRIKKPKQAEPERTTRHGGQ